MGNFSYACKQHFVFTKREYFELFVTALIAGIILALSKLVPQGEVEVGAAIITGVFGLIFAWFALLIHVSAQKLTAIKVGYEAKFEFWKLGFLLGIVGSLLVGFWIPIFFTGTTSAKIIPKLRVGKYSPRFKNWEYGLISFAGPFANLLMILILRPMFMWTGSEVIMFFILANLWTMVWSMMPMPLFHGMKLIESGRTSYDFRGGTTGFNIFLWSRFGYVLFLSLVLVYAFLVLVFNFFSFALSLLIAIIIALIFYFYIESS